MSIYTVKAGDTIESIAMDLFGTLDAVQYLVGINNLQCTYGGTGTRAAWTCQLTPGQVLKADVAEVEAKKLYLGWWIVSGIALASAGIYWRKDIGLFLKKIFN